MADYDKNVVSPLLRRKAHLEEVGADPAKLAEMNHALRMAGYPVDDESSLDSERVVENKPGVPRAEDEVPPTDADGKAETGQDDEEKRARQIPPKERSSKPGAQSTASTGVTSDFLSGKPKGKA